MAEPFCKPMNELGSCIVTEWQVAIVMAVQSGVIS